MQCMHPEIGVNAGFIFKCNLEWINRCKACVQKHLQIMEENLMQVIISKKNVNHRSKCRVESKVANTLATHEDKSRCQLYVEKQCDS